jgi:hypothetical protein
MVEQLIMDVYNEYLISGGRSDKKIKIANDHFKADLRLPYKLLCNSSNTEDKEKNIKYKFGYSKNVDLCGEREGENIFIISTKFVFRNYSQNSNNYIENEYS